MNYNNLYCKYIIITINAILYKIIYSPDKMLRKVKKRIIILLTNKNGGVKTNEEKINYFNGIDSRNNGCRL